MFILFQVMKMFLTIYLLMLYIIKLYYNYNNLDREWQYRRHIEHKINSQDVKYPHDVQHILPFYTDTKHVTYWSVLSNSGLSILIGLHKNRFLPPEKIKQQNSPHTHYNNNTTALRCYKIVKLSDIKNTKCSSRLIPLHNFQSCQCDELHQCLLLRASQKTWQTGK